MKTILVLFGGCSTEYEVSLHSAYAVLSHMDPARYTPLAVGITREGQWLCYTGDLSRLEDGTWQQAADCIPCTPLVEREAHALLLLDGSGRRLLFDAVFPVLHGKNGEDGTVQGLFELAGVPVIGCGTLSSALCMDKDRAHQLAALAGIRVPRSHVFHSSDDFSRIAQAAELVPLENLCLSPQCGFASCEIGNKLTEDEYNELTALLAEKTEKKEQV